MLGHDGPPAGYWRENLITKQPLTCCPIRTLQRQAKATPELAAEVDRYSETYYPAYEDGHLLVAGGISDQPARYLDLIGRIRSVERDIETRYIELTKTVETE